MTAIEDGKVSPSLIDQAINREICAMPKMRLGRKVCERKYLTKQEIMDKLKTNRGKKEISRKVLKGNTLALLTVSELLYNDSIENHISGA